MNKDHSARNSKVMEVKANEGICMVRFYYKDLLKEEFNLD